MDLNQVVATGGARTVAGRDERLAELRLKTEHHPWADRVLARANKDDGLLDAALVWADREAEYLATRQAADEAQKALDLQATHIDELDRTLSEEQKASEPRWAEALGRHDDIRRQVKAESRAAYVLGRTLHQSAGRLWAMLDGSAPEQTAEAPQPEAGRLEIHASDGTILSKDAEILRRHSSGADGQIFYEVSYADPTGEGRKTGIVPESWVVPIEQTTLGVTRGETSQFGGENITPAADEARVASPEIPPAQDAAPLAAPASQEPEKPARAVEDEVEALMRDGHHPANLVFSGWDADVVARVEERLAAEPGNSAAVESSLEATMAPDTEISDPASDIRRSVASFDDPAALHSARVQPASESDTVRLVAGYVECVQGQNFLAQALAAYERGSPEFRTYLAGAQNMDSAHLTEALDRRRDTLIAVTHPLCPTLPPMEMTLARGGKTRVAGWAKERGGSAAMFDAVMTQEFREVARLLAYAEASQPDGVLRDIRGFDPKNAAMVSEDSRVLGNFKSEKDIAAFGDSCVRTIEYANEYSQKNAESLRDSVLTTEGALAPALQKASLLCRVLVDKQPDLEIDQRQVLRAETSVLFGDGISRATSSSLDKNPAAADVTRALDDICTVAAGEKSWAQLQKNAAFMAEEKRSAHFVSYNPSRTRANSFLLEEQAGLKLLGGSFALAYGNLEGSDRQAFWKRLNAIVSKPRSGDSALAVFMLVGASIYGEHREVMAKAISEDVHGKKTGLQMNADRVARRQLIATNERKQKALHVRGNMDRHMRGITGHIGDHTNSLARLLTSGAHMEMGSL